MNIMINRIFEKCKDEKRKAFVAYVAAGDPNYSDSLKVVDALVEGGIDILELGVPFSDPLADGVANQLAAERALNSGMTSKKVLELACDIRKKHPNLPIVLFTYMNPVIFSTEFANFAEFCKTAKQSGVNAILPLDLPPEEAGDYYGNMTDAGLGVVSLIAPTTRKDRIKTMTDYATSFIYYVSQEGVTGERTEFAKGVDKKIAEIKAETDLPVVVGFGISNREQAKAATETGVDGWVMGSAIVRKVEAFSKNEGSINDIKNFISEFNNI